MCVISMLYIPSIYERVAGLIVDVVLQRGSNEFDVQIIWPSAVLVAIGNFVGVGGLTVFWFVSVNGGKYVAGSAVGVGFGQRGSSGIPGPHFNCPNDLHRGSNEPKISRNKKFELHE